MKRFTALLLCFVFVFSMSIPAYAAEITPSSSGDAAVSPLAYNIPDTPHALGYMATVTNLEAQHITYTRYYFAPDNECLRVAGGFWMTGNDTTTSRTVKIELYKIGQELIVDSYTVYSIDNTTYTGFDHTFAGLEDGNYYFVVRNMTTSSLTAERWVSGNFTIF